MSERTHEQSCKGVTKKGVRCRRRIGLVNGYCRDHRTQAPATVAPQEPEIIEAQAPKTMTSQELETAEGQTLRRREVFSADGLKKMVTGFLGWITSKIGWDVTKPARKGLVDAVEKPVRDLVGAVDDALKEPVEDLKGLFVPDRPIIPSPEWPPLKRAYSWEPEMLLIPAGEFLMGSDPQKDRSAFRNEQPQHTLHLPGYYLAKTPLTNAQYATFVEATSHKPPRHWEGGQPPKGKEDHPVVNVSWHDAIAYCRWLSEATGRPYRLPSEAEWEKGARGTDGRIYPWGDHWDERLCNTWEGRKEDTAPVDAHPKGASPYGLLDMAGNVWEWTTSLWGENWQQLTFTYPYDQSDGRENQEADDHVLRVLRGGSANDSQRFVRCALRYWFYPNFKKYYLGFRVVVYPISRPSAL